MQNFLRSSTHNTGACRPHARPSPLRAVTLRRLRCFDHLYHLHRAAARLLLLIHTILHVVTRFLIWGHKRLGALQQHHQQRAPGATVQRCGRTTYRCLNIWHLSLVLAPPCAPPADEVLTCKECYKSAGCTSLRQHNNETETKRKLTAFKL